MKPCRWFMVDLPGYLRGDLPPASRAELVRHLNGCAECRAESERIRRLDLLLDTALPPADDLPEFQAWFLARLDRVVADETHAVSPSRKGKVALASAILPLAAAAVLAFLLLRTASAERESLDVAASPVRAARTLVADADVAPEPSVAVAAGDGAEAFIDYTVVEDVVPASDATAAVVETNG